MRIEDPLRQWKLSPTDLDSQRHWWYDYSRARDRILEITDTAHAPYIVRSNNKRRARLNCMAHLLSQIPYDKVPRPRATEDEYDDEAPLRSRRFVPERY